jgi:hypothetical protein
MQSGLAVFKMFTAQHLNYFGDWQGSRLWRLLEEAGKAEADEAARAKPMV